MLLTNLSINKSYNLKFPTFLKNITLILCVILTINPARVQGEAVPTAPINKVKIGIMINQMKAGSYTLFSEYDFHKYIGINIGAGLGYDYAKLSGKVLDSTNYHELNHLFLLFPITVRIYPFAKDLCIFLGTEFDLRLSTTPKTIGTPERSNEDMRSKSSLNLTQVKWCIGLDYETFFGIILGLRYANVLSNFVDPIASEQLFNTSNLQIMLGISLARIF